MFFNFPSTTLNMTQVNQPPRWDLNQRIPDLSEEKLGKIKNELIGNAVAFPAAHKSFFDAKDLTAAEIADILAAMDDLVASMYDFGEFAIMAYDTNPKDPLSQMAKQYSNEVMTKMWMTIMPFQQKLAMSVVGNPTLLDDPLISKYKFWIQSELKAFGHKLPMDQEELILQKNKSGLNILIALREYYIYNVKLPIEINSEIKERPLGEAMKMLEGSDSPTRKHVLDKLDEVLQSNHKIYSTTLTSIITDWVDIYKKRNYESPLDHSIHENNADKNSLNALMETMERRADYIQSYLILKAKYLGKSVLPAWDMLSPPPIENIKKYSWQEAREIVQNAYYAYDEELGDMVTDIFDQNRIDALPREGKHNSAYQRVWFTDKSSWVLMNFSGNLRDLYTLAHELGHALHFNLSVRENGPLLTCKSAILMESAAKFGEIVITDYLLTHATTKDEKIRVLVQILDVMGYSMFNGTTRYFFELGLCEAIEKGEFFNTEKICDFYLQIKKRIYGDSLTNLEKTKWEWATTPHYYDTSLRFYNYPYIYALNFAFKLRQMMRTNKEEIVRKFKDILAAGNQYTMNDIGNSLGIDFTDPKCWEGSMAEYGNFIEEFKSLIE